MSLRKVLCVDDQQIVHAMHEILLAPWKSRGTSLLHATNGWEALKLLAGESDVDLILLDINMPLMDGLQFLVAVKSTPFSAIPVIIVSTEGSRQESIDRAVELGAAGILPKPFTRMHLESLLKTISP